MDSCLCCGEITRYKLSACNRCTVFEGNEKTDFLVLEQVIGTTLVLQLCSCDCLTIGSETVNDGTRF